MKKYRLKINYSEITEENFLHAEGIRRCGIDNTIVEEHKKDEFSTIIKTEAGEYHNIPKSWLTEIKDALNFAEWFNGEIEVLDSDSSSDIDFDFIRHWAYDSWNAAIENYKLSQKSETRSNDALYAFFDEVGAITGPLQENITTDTIRRIWNAALKYARGQS